MMKSLALGYNFHYTAKPQGQTEIAWISFFSQKHLSLGTVFHIFHKKDVLGSRETCHVEVIVTYTSTIFAPRRKKYYRLIIPLILLLCSYISGMVHVLFFQMALLLKTLYPWSRLSMHNKISEKSCLFCLFSSHVTQGTIPPVLLHRRQYLTEKSFFSIMTKMAIGIACYEGFQVKISSSFPCFRKLYFSHVITFKHTVKEMDMFAIKTTIINGLFLLPVWI